MTTWVLLRGLMREARHWGEFPQMFQAVTGVGQLVMLDFPGNGSLHDQNSLPTVASMAEYCHAQGYPPPYRVLALSLGAMVGVEWSRAYPEEIEKLVLINTSLSPYNPFYHRLRPGNYAVLVRLLLDGSVRLREELILRLTSAKDRSALVLQWARYAQEYPISRANILRQLFAAMRYRAGQPAVPVLLLAGGQDKLVNVKCSLALAQQWGCSIALHPDAGHDLPLDEPLWVAEQVQAWLG